MQSIGEKVAYVKGLAEGLDITTDSKEGKVLIQLIETLDLMAQEIQALQAAQMEMEEFVESIDDDLTLLEKAMLDDEDFDSDDEDDDFLEVECPKCGDVVCLNPGLAEQEEGLCPSCHAPLFSDEE